MEFGFNSDLSKSIQNTYKHNALKGEGNTFPKPMPTPGAFKRGPDGSIKQNKEPDYTTKSVDGDTYVKSVFGTPDDIKAGVTRQLLSQMFQGGQKDEVEKIDYETVLYEVEEGVEAAGVPEYWNAENTSQRIVDFAMSFSTVSKDDFETYAEKMRTAVETGFKDAKKILGDIPGPSAKLFNDTYTLTMKKFDTVIENYKSGRSVSDFVSKELLEQGGE